jgi:hypothetical protein
MEKGVSLPQDFFIPYFLRFARFFEIFSAETLFSEKKEFTVQ